MGCKNKSSSDYESELNILIQQCNNQNIYIDTIKNAYNANSKANKFLKRNNSNH